ncbi:MAG TPA: hypothetical protein VKG65_07385 [Terriglobales bacterium]|nr:hypothetical protein [Terriglobales bacterium]
MQRIRLVFGCLFLAACLVSGVSFAQDNQPVRVGVTVLGSAAGITGAAGRDRLVKALNKQKKSPVQAVPIQASGGDQVSAEAREKNCAFVVFTTQTEAHNEGGASGKPGQTTNIPEYHTTVEYKLYRVSDATMVASGSAKAQDIGSLGDVVQQALDRVATKVAADIKTAAAAPPPAAAPAAAPPSNP